MLLEALSAKSAPPVFADLLAQSPKLVMWGLTALGLIAYMVWVIQHADYGESWRGPHQ